VFEWSTSEKARLVVRGPVSSKSCKKALETG
jgi:hypothetical protein